MKTKLILLLVVIALAITAAAMYVGEAAAFGLAGKA